MRCIGAKPNIAAAAGAAGIIGLGLVVWALSSRAERSHSLAAPPPAFPQGGPPAGKLTPSSDVIDLGILPQAASHGEYFSLTNHGLLPTTIGRIRTSCDCLQVHVARAKLEAGETIIGQATLDLGKSGDFTG